MLEANADPNFHPSFRSPSDSNATIWRYMDFPKFAWMMVEGRLFMPRCPILAQSDPFEASTPIARYKKLQQQANEARPDESRIILENIKRLSSFTGQWGKGCFVSCWYLSEHESDAMWKLYGGSNNCVAVRSTFSALKRSLPPYAFVGLVSYIDYQTDDFPSFNMFENVVHKRKEFEHEREVRAVVMQLQAELNSGFMRDNNEFGYFPAVDLKQLIHSVYVHPLADPWFLNVVTKMSRVGESDLSVCRSAMASVPVF